MLPQNPPFCKMNLSYCHYVSNKIPSHLVFMWIAFHYFRNKDRVSFQYLLSRFYLKLPGEELTKENNKKKFARSKSVINFLSHVLESKSICKWYSTLLANSRKKASVCGIRPESNFNLKISVYQSVFHYHIHLHAGLSYLITLVSIDNVPTLY